MLFNTAVGGLAVATPPAQTSLHPERGRLERDATPGCEFPTGSVGKVEGSVRDVQRHLLLTCDAVALWPGAAGVTEVSTQSQG